MDDNEVEELRFSGLLKYNLNLVTFIYCYYFFCIFYFKCYILSCFYLYYFLFVIYFLIFYLESESIHSEDDDVHATMNAPYTNIRKKLSTSITSLRALDKSPFHSPPSPSISPVPSPPPSPPPSSPPSSSSSSSSSRNPLPLSSHSSLSQNAETPKRPSLFSTFASIPGYLQRRTQK